MSQVNQPLLDDHVHPETSELDEHAGEGFGGALRFDAGKPELSYILTAPHAIKGVSHVFAMGAQKYGRDNWKQGMRYTRMCNSLLRHLTAFMEGETYDPESGLPHIHHAATNALMLAEMTEVCPESDDRFLEE